MSSFALVDSKHSVYISFAERPRGNEDGSSGANDG